MMTSLNALRFSGVEVGAGAGACECPYLVTRGAGQRMKGNEGRRRKVGGWACPSTYPLPLWRATGYCGHAG